MSLDRKGKTMKHKRSLIFVLCGMLLTPSLPVDTMAMTGDADIIRVESVLVKTRGNTVSEKRKRKKIKKAGRIKRKKITRKRA